MSVPASNFVAGNYSVVKDQEWVDYLVKSGFPAEEAKKQLGTHWFCTITDIPGGYFSTYGCTEMPEFNGADPFYFGKVTEIDSVFFGGKAKVLFNLMSDNFFESSADTEKYGRSTWTETYSAEGFKMVMTGPQGAKSTEFWKREGGANSTDMVQGTYKVTKSKEMGDWMVKTGIPEAEAKKHVGTHWFSTIKKIPNGYITSYGCTELPEYNATDVFQYGKDLVIDSPLFGGKAKVDFTETALNHFECSAKTENMGNFTWTEAYTIEGLYCVFTKEGHSVKEFWAREESMEGRYVYDRAENAEAFAKATGAFDDFPEALKSMSCCFTSEKGGFTLVEQTGGYTAKNFFKLNEEFDYVFPAFDDLAAKIVVSKVDGQTFKMVVKKKKDGKLEEWTFKVCPMGALWHGVDKASGEFIKIYMKKAPSCYGRWNYVTESGMAPVLEALGAAPEMVQQALNEKDVSFDFMDLGNGNVRFKMNSKLQPMDQTCRWNEEYEIPSPLIPGKTRCITTMNDNVLTTVTKTDNGTMVARYTFGDAFAFGETEFVGKDMRFTAVFARA